MYIASRVHHENTVHYQQAPDCSLTRHQHFSVHTCSCPGRVQTPGIWNLDKSWYHRYPVPFIVTTLDASFLAASIVHLIHEYNPYQQCYGNIISYSETSSLTYFFPWKVW